MGLGLGRVIRITSGATAVFLLSDTTKQETEVVFRDIFGNAIMVVKDDGSVLIANVLKDNRQAYFGELDV